MSTPQPDVTTLLGLAGQGDAQALEDVFRLLEPHLRHLARARLRQEPPPHDLQTTVLVDEAFLRLVGKQHPAWESRSQFFGYAAKVMRELAVDEARRCAAQKRGGGVRPIPLDQAADLAAPSALDALTLLALDEVLTALARTHPKLEQIVVLYYYYGLNLKQIAEFLGDPYPTVKKRWQRAVAELQRAWSQGDEKV